MTNKVPASFNKWIESENDFSGKRKLHRMFENVLRIRIQLPYKKQKRGFRLLLQETFQRCGYAILQAKLDHI